MSQPKDQSQENDFQREEVPNDMNRSYSDLLEETTMSKIGQAILEDEDE